MAKLKVMISSRNTDSFSNQPLSDIRIKLKSEIENEEIFGQKVFEVWINETTPPQSGTKDSWDVCINAVRDCDILLVLYNGNAGWVPDAQPNIGICHAELMTGLNTSPAKVRLISLGETGSSGRTAKDKERDKRFRDYVNRESLFYGGGIVKNSEELIARVKEALFDALLNLAKSGVREAGRGKFDKGEALDWSRLDFQSRRHEITQVIRTALREQPNSKELRDQIYLNLGDEEILAVPDAIPAALSVPAAKELVGQPFLHDHEFAKFLKTRGGPLHIIGCHKGATEAQALKLLGFPDATVVSTSFGIFVADNIQKVQFAFIHQCRDNNTTRHGVQRFFEWLSQSGEEKLVAERAMSRARIVQVIAEEAGIPK